MPEQEPIPPRRHARRNAPGEDDDAPPWANLPPVRPRRHAAPSGAPSPSAASSPSVAPAPSGVPSLAPQGPGLGGPQGPSPAAPQGPGRLGPAAGTPPGGSWRPGQPSPHSSGPHSSGPHNSGPHGSGPHPVAPRPLDPTGPGSAGPAAPGSAYVGRHNSGPMPAAGPVPTSGPRYSGLPDGLYLPEDDASGQLPEWAMPPADEPKPQSQRRVGAIGDRARRALMRKRRRFYLTIGCVVAVVAGIMTTLLLTRDNSASANISGDLVTTFQPGELQQVPDACRAIPASTIAQYLPGQTKMSAPLPINGKLGSGCNWTLDQPPTYRLLEVNLLAYSPSGLASGDGSATNAASDAYQIALRDMRQPPKGSPAGTVTVINGLGNEAFSSIQVFKAGGATTDVATVTFRYHNVIGTATIDGLIAHNSKGSYGPVDQTQLAAAALAVAQIAASAVH